MGMDMPITAEVYRVLYEGKDPAHGGQRPDAALAQGGELTHDPAAARLQGVGRHLPGPGRGPAGRDPAQGRHRREERRLRGRARRASGSTRPTSTSSAPASSRRRCRCWNSAEAERPPTGVVRLTHFAEAAGVVPSSRPRRRVAARRAAPVVGGDGAVAFPLPAAGAVRSGGARYRAAQATDLPETAEYAGCRSWVDLGRELPTDGATPVLEDRLFHHVLFEMERRLEPRAWV